MSSLIDKLAKTGDESLYLRVLYWLFELPNFILDGADKYKILSRLFELRLDSDTVLKTAFQTDSQILKIKTNTASYAIIKDSSSGHIHSTYFTRLKEFDKIGILCKQSAIHSNDNNISINYSKIAEVLNELTFNDQRTQYIIHDYIQALLQE